MLRSRLVLATFLVVTCAACTGATGDPEPSSTADSTPSAPTAPTSSIPPELAGYTEDERAAYEDAVAAYATFTAKNDKIFAKGQATVGARDFYQRSAIDWSTAWGNLGQIANNGVTVKGTTKIVWTRPKFIELNSGRAVVVIRRCLDESGRIVTQNGERLNQPQLESPHVYTVRLEQKPGEKRWRSGIAEQGKTC